MRATGAFPEIIFSSAAGSGDSNSLKRFYPVSGIKMRPLAHSNLQVTPEP